MSDIANACRKSLNAIAASDKKRGVAFKASVESGHWFNVRQGVLEYDALVKGLSNVAKAPIAKEYGFNLNETYKQEVKAVRSVDDWTAFTAFLNETVTDAGHEFTSIRTAAKAYVKSLKPTAQEPTESDSAQEEGDSLKTDPSDKPGDTAEKIVADAMRRASKANIPLTIIAKILVEASAKA